MNQAEHALWGEFREARELWKLEYTEDDQWICVDENCRAKMLPCCWQRPNKDGEFCKENGKPYKVPPYFRAEPSHSPECRASLRVSPRDKSSPEFHLAPPANYPGRVRLFLEAPSPTSSRPNKRDELEELDNPDRRRVRSTQGVAEACEYYADHPEQHWRSLRVDRCPGSTYEECFVRLGTAGSKGIGRNWIFFDQIWLADWVNMDAELIELPLLSTVDREPRRLVVSTAHWVPHAQSDFRRRLRASLREAKLALREGRGERAWVFFFGREQEYDQTLFRADFQLGIAVLVREMEWRWDLRPGNGFRTKRRELFNGTAGWAPLRSAIVEPLVEASAGEAVQPGEAVRPELPSSAAEVAAASSDESLILDDVEAIPDMGQGVGPEAPIIENSEPTAPLGAHTSDKATVLASVSGSEAGGLLPPSATDASGNSPPFPEPQKVPALIKKFRWFISKLNPWYSA